MTGPALLAAILHAPDDDAPRLVYADWLDEHGEPERAEFVRCQVELARLGRRESDPKWPTSACAGALFVRELELLTPSRFWDWFDMPGWPGSPSAQIKDGREVCITYAQPDGGRQWYVSIRRGFPFTVTLSAANWLAHGDAILAAHPVTEVRLTTWPELRARGFEFSLPGREVRGRRGADERESWQPLCLRLLAAEWPTVKTWHLPPEPAVETFRRYAGARHPEILSRPPG